MGIELAVQSNPRQTPNLISSSIQQAAEGWYDAAVLLPFLVEDQNSGAYVAGERIDAETCDGFATGED